MITIKVSPIALLVFLVATSVFGYGWDFATLYALVAHVIIDSFQVRRQRRADIL
jgi:hypothetical protein